MSNFISWIQNYCWRLIKPHLSDNFKEKCLCGTAWCSQLWWNMPAVPVLGTWSKEFKVILKYITSSKETLAIWVSVSKNKQKKWSGIAKILNVFYPFYFYRNLFSFFEGNLKYSLILVFEIVSHVGPHYMTLEFLFHPELLCKPGK